MRLGFTSCAPVNASKLTFKSTSDLLLVECSLLSAENPAFLPTGDRNGAPNGAQAALEPHRGSLDGAGSPVKLHWEQLVLMRKEAQKAVLAGPTTPPARRQDPRHYRRGKVDEAASTTIAAAAGAAGGTGQER